MDTTGTAGRPDLIHVTVVARVRLYREALVTALDRCASLRVAATVAQLSDVDIAEPVSRSEVLLADGVAEDQPAAVAAFVAEVRNVPVIVIGPSASAEDFLTYAEAGAAGYLTHESSTADLLSMIESVARGELPCSPQLAGTLFRHVGVLAAGQRVQRPEGQLSRREREIVRLIDAGLSNKEIAGRLNITLATVKNHVHNILAKLDVRTRSDAAACVRRFS